MYYIEFILYENHTNHKIIYLVALESIIKQYKRGSNAEFNYK